MKRSSCYGTYIIDYDTQYILCASLHQQWRLDYGIKFRMYIGITVWSMRPTILNDNDRSKDRARGGLQLSVLRLYTYVFTTQIISPTQPKLVRPRLLEHLFLCFSHSHEYLLCGPGVYRINKKRGGL